MREYPSDDAGLERLGTSHHLELVQRDGWSFVRRTRNVSVVAVVAVTDDHGFLLVEQFRAPVNQRVIELPAGLARDEDASESLQTAAERELLEETGYTAKSWTKLATVTSSAGLTNEVVTVFSAKQLTRAAAGGGVDNEKIIVHEIALDSAAKWLDQQSAAGALIDGRVFAGLYWTQRAA